MTFHEPTPPTFESPQQGSHSWQTAPLPPAAPPYWDAPQPVGHMYTPPPASRFGATGTLAVVGTGVHTFGLLLLQVFNATVGDSPDTSGGVALFAMLALTAYFGGAVFGYVTLCLWMVRAQHVARSDGYPWPATWKIWAGWLIPFYSLVAPYRVMSTLADKAARDRVAAPLAVWWSGWLLAALVGGIAGSESASVGTVQAASVVGAAAIIGSYVSLVILIRRVSSALDAPVTSAW